MVRSGQLATKTNPPAVTTGAVLFEAKVTFAEPVSLMPLAARPGTTPSGTLHRISPAFRSMATSEVQGGLMAGAGGSRSIPPPAAALRVVSPATVGFEI